MNISFAKNSSVICILFLLSACSSTTPVEKTQYFLLTPAATSVTDKNSSHASNEFLILEQIKLAKFLDQTGIVLQTDTHQIEAAHYHRWAEPLKHNLHRYISSTLSNHSEYQFTDKQNSDGVKQDEILSISIDQFHGTKDGNALLAGEWSFKQHNYAFSYQTALTQPGYAELVTQLASLLDGLCTDIAKELITQ